MPIFDHHTVLEIARNIKVFFRFQAGLTRGVVSKNNFQDTLPEKINRQLLKTKDQQIAELRARLSRAGSGARTRHINPANITWIFGTARVGSTWLGAMMEDLRDHSVWHEPIVGRLFGDFYYSGAAVRRGKHFIMDARQHGPIWCSCE